MSTPEIACTNYIPTVMSDADCQTLCAAMAQHLPVFCAEKGMEVPVITYYPDHTKVPAASIEMALLPAPAAGSADAGVEAYHEDVNDHPDGKIYAGYLLANGGAKFTGELAVSVAFAHEVLEYLRNPRTNLVLQNPPVAPDGKTYATLWAEVGDPAQGEHYVYMVGTQEVWLAGFTTQQWEDPAGQPPYSLPNNLVPGPLRIGPKGYGGYGDLAGNTSTVFAIDVHPVIRALKEMHGRLAEAHEAIRVAKLAALVEHQTSAPLVVPTATLPEPTRDWPPGPNDPLSAACTNEAANCAHHLYEHAFHPHHSGPPHECLAAGCGCKDFVAPPPAPEASKS